MNHLHCRENSCVGWLQGMVAMVESHRAQDHTKRNSRDGREPLGTSPHQEAAAPQLQLH